MNISTVKEMLLKIKSDKKALLAIVFGILGLILIMSADTDKNEKVASQEDYSSCFVSRDELCSELENLIESISGAGKARVMLTFEGSAESVFAADSEERTSTEGETDLSKEYIIIDGGDGETGLRLKMISPKIRGVAVVCKGGRDPVIKEQIISAVSALFDISSNKISVAEMAG